MASVVAICNRALQKLGAKRITSLSDDSVNARACNACYEIIRDAELRAHPWKFSIQRAELAADAVAPDWGKAASYTLPADYLRMMNDYPEDNSNSKDWEIEGRKIYTDDAAPIFLRYVARISDASLFDVLFVEVLASKMAFELCEEITQSNAKKESIREDYKTAISLAKRTNAIEGISAQPPEDTWITARR